MLYRITCGRPLQADCWMAPRLDNRLSQRGLNGHTIFLKVLVYTLWQITQQAGAAKLALDGRNQEKRHP
jgi:hypothetical protein